MIANIYNMSLNGYTIDQISPKGVYESGIKSMTCGYLYQTGRLSEREIRNKLNI